MKIKKLPPHVINRLKAGEIVERPVAVVKELIENALDADATRLVLILEKGGKERIRLEDNGEGIPAEELAASVERYATSKIASDRDLEAIGSYGFRGEALASIAEVSSLRIQSRHQDDDLPEGVGAELWKEGSAFKTKEIPFGSKNGTIVTVDELFSGIPARKKFLKTDSTEWKHCKKLFLSYCIVHWGKAWKLKHNGKVIYDFPAHESMVERMAALYKKDRKGKWNKFEWSDDRLHIYGVAGDASLHFSSQKYVHIFVNGRPVQDRLLKKSLLDAYERQIVPGSYPFVHLFVDIDPELVDVNVHPRKLEVKFLDPGSMFTRVKETIFDVLSNEKINYAAFRKHPVQQGRRGSMSNKQLDNLKNWRKGNNKPFSGADGTLVKGPVNTETQDSGFGFPGSVRVQRGKEEGDQGGIDFANDHVQILGQLWNSYIIAQGVDDVYYIDQHALAERIAFEKMKQQIIEVGFESEKLLQPITLEYPDQEDIEELLDRLGEIGFDATLFGEEKIILYAIPAVFAEWKLDIELVFQRVWSADELPEDPQELFKTIIDEMVGMKACKASIKAGQKLSFSEMKQLLRDGMQYVEGLFVCQHGRPSAVKVERRYVDALFER